MIDFGAPVMGMEDMETEELLHGSKIPKPPGKRYEWTKGFHGEEQSTESKTKETGIPNSNKFKTKKAIRPSSLSSTPLAA
jgi:hypothetical protein